MNTTLRRILTALTLPAAAATLALTAGPANADTPDTTATTPADNHTDDSWWGTPPTNPPAPAPTQPLAAPMDSWWG
ncbi:hypothetical protein AB0933_32770 [Streptomyces venezuelae]|uniref:hypothetical protein n=1 Tax=Streptomyces venezuelae TaxID=54571 RepID=UPI003453C347